MNRQHPPLRKGAINLGCIGLIVTITFLWMGAQGLYTALRNSEPHKTTVREYVAQKPDAEWVIFQNASLNLLECAYVKGKTGKTKEIFIPVRHGDEKEGAQVHVLLSTKSPDTIAAFEELEKAEKAAEGKGKSPENDALDVKTLEMLAKNASKLFVRKDVAGLVRFGVMENSKTRDKLASLDMNLAPDFVILSEGEEPSFIFSLIFLGLGLTLGYFLLSSKSKEEKAQPTPPPLPNA